MAEKIFFCSICKKHFSTIEALESHVESKHEGNPEVLTGKKVMCPVCDKQFVTKEDFESHAREKHEEYYNKTHKEYHKNNKRLKIGISTYRIKDKKFIRLHVDEKYIGGIGDKIPGLKSHEYDKYKKVFLIAHTYTKQELNDLFSGRYEFYYHNFLVNISNGILNYFKSLKEWGPARIFTLLVMGFGLMAFSPSLFLSLFDLACIGGSFYFAFQKREDARKNRFPAVGIIIWCAFMVATVGAGGLPVYKVATNFACPAGYDTTIETNAKAIPFHEEIPGYRRTLISEPLCVGPRGVTKPSHLTAKAVVFVVYILASLLLLITGRTVNNVIAYKKYGWLRFIITPAVFFILATLLILVLQQPYLYLASAVNQWVFGP